MIKVPLRFVLGLHFISNTLQIYDELCNRAARLIYSCLLFDNPLVRLVTLHHMLSMLIKILFCEVMFKFVVQNLFGQLILLVCALGSASQQFCF